MHPSDTNESDWQTVSTEQAMQRRFDVQLGSSIADYSATGPDSLSYDVSTAATSHVGDDNGSPRRGIRFTNFRHHNNVTAPRPSQSWVYPTQKNSPTHLRTNMRRLSSSLDGLSSLWEKATRAFDGHPFSQSLESLHSNNSLQLPSIINSTRTPNYRVLAPTLSPSETVSDGDSPKTPLFSFPLISLPQAAKIQHIRRDEGEEDHTCTGRSFATRSFSDAASSASSFSDMQMQYSKKYSTQAAKELLDSHEAAGIRFVPNSMFMNQGKPL